MKNTPFTNIHTQLDAKMAEFAGYNMPISYSGINNEHAAVRNSLGIFDVSHMGEFLLKGEHALELIQRITSNDASKLTNGKAQYSCFPNKEGGIVDDLLVYCIEENKVYMLVVNASNMQKDWDWIMQHNTNGVEMKDISNQTALLAVQGPNAVNAMQQLTDMDLINLKYYTFCKGTFAGIDNVVVSATGYTGAGGVEIYFPASFTMGDESQLAAETMWHKIMEAGAAFNIKPCGLAARDTLRLEMGFCLYGNDIDDTTSPLEAGLGWITKFTKDFTNSAALQQQKADGVKQKLVGFEMIDKGIPRHHYLLKSADGNTIGHVSSGTQSPSLGKAIGLGYVSIEHASIGSEIFVEVREKLLKAVVVKIPFYQG